MNGIIMGALAGTGQALQTIGVNAQHTMDQQDLLKTQADLGEQKAKAIADYQNQLGLTTAANERARIQGEIQNEPPGATPSTLLASTGDLGTASAIQAMNSKEAEANAKLQQATTAAERAKAQGELNDAKAAQYKAEQDAYGKEVTKDAFGNPILIDKSSGKVTPLTTPTTVGANGAGLTGDDFLKTLSPNIANQVKAISEGRQALPSGFAMKSPMGAQLLSAVSQYDPSFDVVNASARTSTRKAFTSGKEALTVNKLNTAIGHAGTLLDQISGTASHGGFPGATLVNAVQNKYSQSSGDAGVTNFKDTAGKLAEELTAVYRGGNGSEKDVARSLESFDPDLSREQKIGVLKNTVALLHSKMDAMNDQYQTGMGTAKVPLTLINSHAQQAIDAIQALEQKLNGNSSAQTSHSTENTQPQTNTPAPVPPVNAQGWTLHVDAQGNQAYVSPDGKSYQEVQ